MVHAASAWIGDEDRRRSSVFQGGDRQTNGIIFIQFVCPSVIDPVDGGSMVGRAETDRRME
jgi:hypothetical protein